MAYLQSHHSQQFATSSAAAKHASLFSQHLRFVLSTPNLEVNATYLCFLRAVTPLPVTIWLGNTSSYKKTISLIMYVDLPGIFQFLLDDKSLSQSYKSSAGRQRRQYGDTLPAAKERGFLSVLLLLD